jgi:hypothetical protein
LNPAIPFTVTNPTPGRSNTPGGSAAQPAKPSVVFRHATQAGAHTLPGIHTHPMPPSCRHLP